MEHSYVAKVTDGAFFLVSVGDQFNLELRIQEQDKEYSELVASTATVIHLDILSKIKEFYNLIRFSEYGADNSDFLNIFLTLKPLCRKFCDIIVVFRHRLPDA